MKFSFSAYSSFTLFYNLAVILWGAFVRASGSGAGCGAHWPLCNGEVLPRAPEIATLIEFSHRLTSGLALVFVVALYWFARKTYEPGAHIRYWAGFSLVFMILEALIGAALVLLKLVGDDASAYRAIVVGAHLINSFFLVATLTLTAWAAQHGAFYFRSISESISKYLLPIVVFFLLVSCAGAITALGDTLFPSESLRAGIEADFSVQAHFLIRLRIWHPALAVVLTACIWLFCSHILSTERSEESSKNAEILRWCMLGQVALGALNIVLLAPVWMQITHLLFACVSWILLVRLCASLGAALTPIET